MQYGIMQDTNLLIAAAECELMGGRANVVTGEFFEEFSLPYFKVYGGYLPQRHRSNKDALEDMTSRRGLWHTAIVGDTAEMIAIHDVNVIAQTATDNRVICFAAVIQAFPHVVKMIRESSFDYASVGFFPWVEGVSLKDLILQRHGIFAMNWAFPLPNGKEDPWNYIEDRVNANYGLQIS